MIIIESHLVTHTQDPFNSLDYSNSIFEYPNANYGNGDGRANHMLASDNFDVITNHRVSASIDMDRGVNGSVGGVGGDGSTGVGAGSEELDETPTSSSTLNMYSNRFVRDNMKPKIIIMGLRR